MSVCPPYPHTPGWSGKEQGSKSPRISACAAAAMAPHSAPLRTHHAACQGRMIDEEWATLAPLRFTRHCRLVGCVGQVLLQREVVDAY